MTFETHAAPFRTLTQIHYWIMLLLTLSAVLIVYGLTLPALQVTSFYVFTREMSIYDGIRTLHAQGDVWLAALLFTFTVAFPLTKVAIGFLAILVGGAVPRLTHAVLALLSALSKWSMLDVFAVALVVLALNGRAFTTSNVEIGVALFTFGIFLSTVSVHALRLHVTQALSAR